MLRYYAGADTAAIIRFPAGHGARANELFITNVGATSPITFATQDTERMRIDSNGSVVIGSTVANGRFSVTPSSNPTTLATSTTITLNEATNNAAYQLRMAYSYLASTFTGVIDAVQNSAGAPLTINPTGGNVGIGTTTPVAQLAVYGAGQTTAAMSTSSGLGGTLYVRDNAGAPGNGGAVMFGASQGAFAAIKGLITDGANNTLGALAFSNRNASTDATLTERMRIDPSGNLLVGTTTATGKLTVIGAAAGVAGYFSDSINSSLVIATLSGGVTLGTDAGGQIHLATDGATAAKRRLSIDSNGNVGIGTTSPIRKLTVSNAGSCEFVLQDTSQAADSRNWRVFNTSNTLYFGTLNDAGTSGTDVMHLTSGADLRFNSGYGSVATAYGCRAWCQYNQSATIIGSGNISSITVVGTGDVRLNFATALVDANYSAVATTNESGGQPKWCNSTQPTTTTIRIVTFNANQSTGWFEYNFVAVFR
jgi:hypothetical protein